MIRWIIIIVVVVLLVLAAAAAVVIGPRNIIGMLRYDQRRAGALKTGEQAPDVRLLALDGTSEVHLRDHIGPKPLVLIFGSYT